jgi:hypothetical protein
VMEKTNASGVALGGMVVVKGGACSGKSVLMARLVHHLKALSASPKALSAPRLVSFVFVPGGQREGAESNAASLPGPGRAGKWDLCWVINYLAADILSQLGRTTEGAQDEVARLAVDMELAWRWRYQPTPLPDRPATVAQAMDVHRWASARRRLVEAVVAAVTPSASPPDAAHGGAEGYSVLCVVDGLNDTQVDELNELVESLQAHVLVNLATLVGRMPVFKVVASTASLPKVWRHLRHLLCTCVGMHPSVSFPLRSASSPHTVSSASVVPSYP